MGMSEWRKHTGRLFWTLVTLVSESLFLAAWTLLTYWAGEWLFERIQPPGYERVVIDVVRLTFTLALIVSVLWFVVLDAVRSVVSAWLDFTQWYRERRRQSE